MTTELVNSPWLSDWRTYLDETWGMSPSARRVVEAAIRQGEADLNRRHADAYSRMTELHFARRNEVVVQPCVDMRAELREIRSEVAAGRMTPQAARARIRDIHQAHQRITALHDDILAEQPEREAFAELTADEYQRDQVAGRFPVAVQTMPTLAKLVAETDYIPPGGTRTRNPNPPPGGGTDPDVWEQARAST